MKTEDGDRMSMSWYWVDSARRELETVNSTGNASDVEAADAKYWEALSDAIESDAKGWAKANGYYSD